MFPILLSIGPLTLKTYGLLVALGFLAGYWVVRKRLKLAGYSTDTAEKLLTITILGGILGGRLGYVLTNPTPWQEIPMIWRGGLSFVPGLLVAGVSVILFSIKRKIPIPIVSDAFALAMPLAHAIGRMGCLAAGCCWGRPLVPPGLGGSQASGLGPTASFLSITFHNPQCVLPTELLGVALHPTQIYESAGNLIILSLLWLGRKKYSGKLFGIYLLLYGILRFNLENIRGSNLTEPHILGLTVAQAAIVFLFTPIAFLWFFLTRSKPKQ